MVLTASIDRALSLTLPNSWQIIVQNTNIMLGKRVEKTLGLGVSNRSPKHGKSFLEVLLCKLYRVFINVCTLVLKTRSRRTEVQD